MPKYISTIHGNLKVKDEMLNYGDEIELTSQETLEDPDLRQLVTSRQLVRKINK